MIMRTSGQRCSADHLTRTLDQSPSTIRRDVPRFAVWTDRPACAADNTCGHGARATAPRAGRQRFKCRKRFKQVTDTVLFGAVLRSLAHGWSLWQLVKPIHPDEPQRIVSQESVYNCIYVMLRGRYLIASLRRPQSKRIPPSRGEDHRELNHRLRLTHDFGRERNCCIACYPAIFLGLCGAHLLVIRDQIQRYAVKSCYRNSQISMNNK